MTTGNHSEQLPSEPDDANDGEPREAPRVDRGEGPESGDAETGETVQLRVYRYDPEVEGKREPRYDDFYVPYERGLTVLDALIYARDRYDSSLTFRHSCRQGICGSDAFFINGSQGLGCQTQVGDLAEPVRVEPLPYFDVVKDLVVDLEDFYEQMHGIEPYLQPDSEPPGDLTERRQSPENREEIKMAARCIWCASCSSSCSIYGQSDRFVGPAAINVAYRFVMDEREDDAATDRRLDLLAEEEGVWRCQTQFSCTNVCPKDIPITEEIQAMKREAVKKNVRFW